MVELLGAFKMFRVVLVLVSLIMVNAEGPDLADDITMLDEFFFEQYGLHINEWSLHLVEVYRNDEENELNSIYDPSIWEKFPLPFVEEILEYLQALHTMIVLELATDLERITVFSLYEDLRDHCSEYLDMPVVDLRVEPKNTTCVVIRLVEVLRLKVDRAIEVGLKQLSRQCIEKKLSFCMMVNPNCTICYQERVEKMMSGFIADVNNLVPGGETPIGIIEKYVANTMVWVSQPFNSAYSFLATMAFFIYSEPSIEPFTIENLMRPWYHQALSSVIIEEKNNTLMSKDELTWGIVKSKSGSVDLPCLYFRHKYKENSDDLDFLRRCYYLNIFQSNSELMRCAFTNQTSRPLSWQTASSVYFHSHCLCLISNDNRCGVKEIEADDSRYYCLSVLLRDFQRQISYRPAITYLDYSFKTRLPICKFANLLQLAFKGECDQYDKTRNLHFMLSVQCFFKNLVNKHLNCTETLLVDTYNHTLLCNLEFFMELVLCDGNDSEIHVPYYGYGDSILVQFLTYIDVFVRVLTLITYLACPQLRNLPGKMLVSYQMTALLRLLVVRASLADFALAVRLDVATDLATTLWLTAYLHFLTVSIADLRPPDSLSSVEARMVLFRYALFGWALPASLSVTLFWVDEVIDSRVQFGQLFFVLCNYAALFSNLYMFFKNSNFYFDIKKNAQSLQKGGKKCSVYAGLFNFAIKTSILSGAGIIFRLVFTQIQGLEHLLGYYHVLGTIQGLLLFVLYGCNRESRVFWLSVICSTFRRWRPQNNPTL